VLLLKVLEVYLEGHDDDEEEQEGMLPAMKVNENYKIIILRQRKIFKTSSTYTEASLVKKLEELGLVVRQLITISTIINRNYVEKGNLDGRKEKIYAIDFKQGNWRKVIERKYRF
jgi:DNA topoisomerase-1